MYYVLTKMHESHPTFIMGDDGPEAFHSAAAANHIADEQPLCKFQGYAIIRMDEDGFEIHQDWSVT